MKDPVQKNTRESGQAILLLVLGMSIFLLGAVGFAIDGSHLYAERQMAQAAADAAAQAGILSIFNGTNLTTSTHYFSTTTGEHTCGTSAPTPCYYAETLNGFSSGSDTVTYEPNPGVTVPGLSSDPVNLLRVKVQRNVDTTLMRFLGPSTATIAASGTAAIVTALAPIPILVLHPTLAASFSKNGTNDITICGGPARSIQVNSSNTGSVSISGTSGTVNLSHAGPLDSGSCTTGTGADFGNHGGPTAYPGTILLGSLPGVYRQSSPITDPLIGMSAPPTPTTVRTDTNGSGYQLYTGASAVTHGCPSTLPASADCRVYSPGKYDAGINLGGSSKAYALFRPGIYYINHNGFQLDSNSIVRMADSPDNSDPTPASDPAHTTWTRGILVYNSPASPINTTKDIISVGANSGQINNITYPNATQCGTDSSGTALGGNCFVGANGGVLTTGLCSSPTALASSYYGVLFFQNRSIATSLTHTLSGGGGLSVKGTVYLAHTSTASDGSYQSLSLQGTSGSSTLVQGEIISDALSLGGTSGVTMNLNSLSCYSVREVALVR